MAQDTYTEITTQSWFSRMKDSVVGVLLGLLLFIVSFGVLWINEGRAVKTAEALQEMNKTVISLPAAEVSPANEGKLIYVNGMAKTQDVLGDPTIGISINAISLIRKVQVYQWVEHSKSEKKEKLGGSTETVTTFTYEKEWSGSPEDSANFKKPEGHTNLTVAYSDTTLVAKNASLGQFKLSPGLINKIGATEDYVLSEGDLAKLSGSVRSKTKMVNNYLYIGSQTVPDPASPQIGDCRIRYQIIPAEIAVSVISKQISNTFEPYLAKNGRSMELLESGTVSAESMVQTAEKNNKIITWLLRLLGFILMGWGLSLILKPLSTLGAVIPLLGRILGGATGFIAFMVALALSLITIAIAWIVYRPVLAVILLILAVLTIFLIHQKNQPDQSKKIGIK